MLIVAIKGLDILAVFVAGVVAFAIRHGGLHMSSLQLGLLLLAPPILSFWFRTFGAYSSARAPNGVGAVNALIIGGFAGAATLMVLGYVTKTSQEFSRAWLLLWAPLALVLLVFERNAVAAISRSLHSAGIGRRRIAIIGQAPLVETLLHGIELTPEPIEIVATAFLTDDSEDCIEPFRKACTASDPHEIVIAVAGPNRAVIERLVVALSSFDADIDLFVEAAAIRWPFDAADTIGGMPILRVMNRPWRGWPSVIKAVEDRLGAALLIIALAPLMGIIALAIKLFSPGPILFLQQRSGFRDRPFTLFKFRTMHDDPACQSVAPAVKNDPRVTGIGRFLRRTSLDELPQLFNVLAGSMSLVGPRPHAVAHSRHFARMTDAYLWRKRVRPGMTGWAQVNGYRGEIKTADDLERQIAYDLFYIENWSVMFDVMILFRSVLLCFHDSRAY